MIFLAQVASAAHQLQPSGTSAIETMGLLGIAYALVRTLDGLIAKALPGRIGKRQCSWSETDAGYVTAATRQSASELQIMSTNLRAFGEIVHEMQRNQVEMRVSLAAHQAEAGKR